MELRAISDRSVFDEENRSESIFFCACLVIYLFLFSLNCAFISTFLSITHAESPNVSRIDLNDNVTSTISVGDMPRERVTASLRPLFWEPNEGELFGFREKSMSPVQDNRARDMAEAAKCLNARKPSLNAADCSRREMRGCTMDSVMSILEGGSQRRRSGTLLTKFCRFFT